VEDPVLFALAVLTILGTPGPTNSLLATSGAMHGIRGSLLLIPAETAGYLIAIMALGLVLGPLVTASPLLSAGLRAAVGAYLLLLALRLWRRGSLVEEGLAPVTPWQVFLTTLLNPKAIVFALGVMPFGAPRLWPYLAGFVLLLVCVALGWIVIGAALGGLAQSRGLGRLVPRMGATAVGTFAILFLAYPLLH
jgi:threonine/homoserine/homoserine lactone efflux protein